MVLIDKKFKSLSGLLDVILLSEPENNILKLKLFVKNVLVKINFETFVLLNFIKDEVYSALFSILNAT